MAMHGKVAVIFGGSGAIGSTTAGVLAREGVQLWLGGRSQQKLDVVAERLRKAGGNIETFTVDVLDEASVTGSIEKLLSQAGGIDLMVNATGFMHQQGKSVEDLTLAEFREGFAPFLTAQFTIAKAAARHMGGERAGCLISVVAPAARMAMPGHAGHIVGCAGIEAFTKAVASELGPKNIRVLCLRSHAIVDAVEAGSYTREVFEPKAKEMGLTVEEWLGGAAQSTVLKRLPTLAQVAEMIVFLASVHAAAMTGSVVNMTAGATTE